MGFDPAISQPFPKGRKTWDARDKHGHDDQRDSCIQIGFACPEYLLFGVAIQHGYAGQARV